MKNLQKMSASLFALLISFLGISIKTWGLGKNLG